MQQIYYIHNGQNSVVYIINMLQTAQRCVYNHRLCGSASPVLTATGFVNGKWQFSTPHRIDTPQLITKNFVTGDYVGDPYGCDKLGAYPSKGASGHMGEI